MEEQILKMIIENKNSHMSLKEGEIASAKEIADHFEKFIVWKDAYVNYIPRYEDTLNTTYLYVWWDGLEVKDRHFLFMSLKELYTYWLDNFENK